MKLTREQQILEFFKWLASTFSRQISDALLGKVLLYALHSSKDLDVKKIYTSLASNPELRKRTMFVAEQLIAKGEARGMSKGMWIGKILALDDLLDGKLSNLGHLESLSLAELEKCHSRLQEDCKMRFKRP